MQLQIFLPKLNSSETFFLESAKTILSAVHQHPQTWLPVLLPIWVNSGEVQERGVIWNGRMTKVETSTGSTALCVAGKDTPVVLLSLYWGKGGVCRFSKVKGRKGAGDLENTTSFGFKGWHLETQHHLSGIPMILRPCVKGHTLHSQILCESLNFKWMFMGNKWEQWVFGEHRYIIQIGKGLGSSLHPVFSAKGKDKE